jgi:hypothetical protein
VQQVPAIDGIIDDEDFGFYEALPFSGDSFPLEPDTSPTTETNTPLSPMYLMRWLVVDRKEVLRKQGRQEA